MSVDQGQIPHTHTHTQGDKDEESEDYGETELVCSHNNPDERYRRGQTSEVRKKKTNK